MGSAREAGCGVASSETASEGGRGAIGRAVCCRAAGRTVIVSARWDSVGGEGGASHSLRPAGVCLAAETVRGEMLSPLPAARDHSCAATAAARDIIM